MATINEIKMSERKQVINKLFNDEFISPFKVLAWFNKNRNNEHIAAWMDKYGITDKDGKLRKLDLSDLLQFTPEGSELSTFCKLQSSDKDGKAITSFYDESKEKVWYYIPIKFSVNEFMRSVESFVALRKKEISCDKWKADASNRKKREEAKAKKLADKVKELKAEFSDKSNEELEALAKKLFKL